MIWKVRPTPSRQTARGLMPTMSRPASCTIPLSGASWPFSMLKQVLLPAPLGPISASNSPADRAKETSSTACTPPNALCRPSTRRTTSFMPNGPLRQTARPAPEAADEPLRESDDDQQDQQAEGRAPEVGLARQRVAQPGEERRADDRAGQGLDPAQQDHHQPVGRLRDRHGRGRDAALGEGEHRAGKARQRARQDEGHPLEGTHVDADRPRRATANRGRRAARSRTARTGCATGRRCPARSTPGSGSSRSSCPRAMPPARCRPGRCCRR